MAVTAKFQADFSDFDNAVKKAEVELRSFETSASKVEKSLARMTDSFSGRKLIADATLMAEAVQRVGGVSKLTADEVARIGAKAVEATAKMKAMGIEVPPQLQKIADEARKLQGGGPGSFGGLISMAGSVAAGLGLAFSVGAVINYGKSILELGSHLVDLSKKTGISIEALQLFGRAAEKSGSTIDDVNRAIIQLQKRLAGDDKSAVKAVEDLGLSLDNLLKSSPEDMLQQVARALADIEDPAIRTKTQIELLGKTDIDLAALSEEIDKLRGNMHAMSRETAEALDAAGEAWSGFFADVKNGIADFGVEVAKSRGRNLVQLITGVGNISDFKREMDEIAASIHQVTEAAKGPGTKTAKPLGPITLTPEEAEREARGLDKIHDAMKKLQDEQDAARKKADEQRQAQLRLVESTSELTFKTLSLGDAFGKLPGKVPAPAMADLLQHTISLDQAMKQLGPHLVLPEMTDLTFKALTLDEALAQLPGTIEKVNFKPIGEKFGDFLKNDLGKIILGAFQGGGDIAKTIGSAIGGFFTSATSGVGQALAGKMKDIFKDTIGGAINTILPGLGSLIGGFAGKVAGLLGKAFGIDKEAEKVNKLRDAFQNSFGTFEEMHRRFFKLGLDVKDLLDTKKVKDFDAAVAEFNRRLALQQDTWEQVKDAAARYGLTLEALGPAFAAGLLGEKAAALYKDFQLLTGAGAEAGAVLRGMKDEINAFLNDAIKTGTKVPEEMRGMIERMRDMGLLVDENGNLITDLGAAGVEFAKTTSEAFSEVADSLKEMIDLLKSFLGLQDNAALDIPAPDEALEGADALSEKWSKDLPEAVDKLKDSTRDVGMDMKTKLPADAERAARDIEGELGRIRPPTIHIPIEWDVPDMPTGGGGDGGAGSGGFRAGAATSGAATFGRVLPFMPAATATPVPFTAATNSAPVTITNHFTVNGVQNPADMATWLKTHGIPLINQEIARNQNSVGKNLKQALR